MLIKYNVYVSLQEYIIYQSCYLQPNLVTPDFV